MEASTSNGRQEKEALAYDNQPGLMTDGLAEGRMPKPGEGQTRSNGTKTGKE